MDAVLLYLVEDLVPSTCIEAGCEGAMAVVHVAGDQNLDRLCLAADRVLGPAMNRIGRSSGTRASFSGSHRSWKPLMTE